jgi:hypothetical protein
MAKTLKHIKRRREDPEEPRPVRSVRSRAVSVHARLGAAPAILWFLGGLVLLLWLAGTVTQIQTSEYLAQGGVQQVTGVAWGVLMQPLLLVSGQAPAQYMTSWEYGWGVEALTLVFSLALVAAYLKIYAMNPLLAKAFVLIAFILLALNSWADFNSSPGSSTLIRMLVALTIGLMVTAGLPLGVGLIEYGIEEYR